jgi:predicted PurR-regulated permease PerM
VSEERAPELVAEPSPGEMRDPESRAELRKATIWFGTAGAIALVVVLIQPLLVILGALVFAALLDGGVRLLGRVLKIGRGWRLAIVVLLTVAFIGLTAYRTGTGIIVQAQQLRTTLEGQGERLTQWAQAQGLQVPDAQSIMGQVAGSVGKLTSWVGTAVGGLTTFAMILILGLFIAIEPDLYGRGLQWMVPLDMRENFAITLNRMARQMRRLLAGRLIGMAFEGVMTWLALLLGGVPMALVLGIITGLLAFIPNIGAITSGLIMVAVGFSAGMHTGWWAIATYVFIQTFDGYVVIPMVARRTVDLPPALTLGAQILASTLFGILGLALADPMTAMIKVWLERQSELHAKRGEGA